MIEEKPMFRNWGLHEAVKTEACFPSWHGIATPIMLHHFSNFPPFPSLLLRGCCAAIRLKLSEQIAKYLSRKIVSIYLKTGPLQLIYIGKLETSPYISVHQRKMIAYQLASHKNVNIIEWGAGTILIWPLPIPLVM